MYIALLTHHHIIRSCVSYTEYNLRKKYILYLVKTPFYFNTVIGWNESGQKKKEKAKYIRYTLLQLLANVSNK